MPRATGRAEWSFAAIVVPAIAAGTLFLLWLGLAAILSDPQGLPITLADVPGIPLFLVPATMVGFVLALLPLVGGVKLMAWLGCRNVAARLDVGWLLAGAAMPGAFVLASGTSFEEPVALALILTGALCALLARRYVRWTDSL